MKNVTVLRSRITMRDDFAPHQIRLSFTVGKVQMISVSCTCRPTGYASKAGPSYIPLASRDRWDDAGEPMRIWRQHVTEVAP